jgi:hypothetical protein
MEQQLVRRTCDHCGNKFVFTAAQDPSMMAPAEKAELVRWIATIVFLETPGGPQPTVKHYCRTGCAINGLKTTEPSAAAPVAVEKPSRRKKETANA